jgi:hypothetical protein
MIRFWRVPNGFGTLGNWPTMLRGEALPPNRPVHLEWTGGDSLGDDAAELSRTCYQDPAESPEG